MDIGREVRPQAEFNPILRGYGTLAFCRESLKRFFLGDSVRPHPVESVVYGRLIDEKQGRTVSIQPQISAPYDWAKENPSTWQDTPNR